jgi:NADPH-dependent glutamate synthase beta subunit-like oxidoreductase
MTAPAQPAPAIAVVGAGPSGFYVIDALLRALPSARIDLIERLPVPLGLVRFGVAPDHQGTKAVSRQFERLLQKPGLRLLANVELGRDVTLEELRSAYDAVVLAIGCPRDRKLGIPGEDLAGVIGSWQFVGWFNGHPDHTVLEPALAGARSVAAIGNGNVAIDVVRVLAKTPAEMANSDLAPHAAAAMATASLHDLHMVGRRGPAEASFTTAELAELGRLERVVPVIEGAAVPDQSGAADPAVARIKDANLAAMRAWTANVAGSKPVTLHLSFNATPVALHGEGGRVRMVELARTGEPHERWMVPADLVVTCIGYDAVPIDVLPMERGVIANDDGRVRGHSGLYVVGWAKRGPSGVIATNRADSIAVAERIVADLTSSSVSPKEGGAQIDRALADRRIDVVDAAGWQRIDRAETAAGQAEGRPRIKLATLERLMQASRG